LKETTRHQDATTLELFVELLLISLGFKMHLTYLFFTLLSLFSLGCSDSLPTTPINTEIEASNNGLLELSMSVAASST
jgi:hypothetical protein